MDGINLGRVAIFGSTGLVGRELLSLLETKKIPLDSVALFASPESLGVTIPFRGKSLPVRVFSQEEGEKFDFAFLCASESLSRSLTPILLAEGTRVIDSSSAFRADPTVPLAVPEVNGELLTESTFLVASPNCIATLLVMALAPLHKEAPLREVLLSTYQAASGAGKLGLEALFHPDGPSPFPHPFLYNLFPHESPRDEEGFCVEERKIVSESRKILGLADLPITATAVRVPVARAHSISAFLRFASPISVERAAELLRNAPGVLLQPTFPTPLEREKKEEVAIGPIRAFPDGLILWIVGDQLLKGAALNALQIALTLAEKSSLCPKT